MDIVEATRTQSGFVSGVSTRGALALYQAAQAYASLQGREYVIPEDIKGLAPAVLSHRISLGSSMNAEAAALRMRKLLAEITVPIGECGMSAVIFALLWWPQPLGWSVTAQSTALTMCRGGWKWRIILWKPGSPP